MAIKKSDLYSLIDATTRLARSDVPDFNDPNKLGEGKDMVEKLSS